MKLFFIRLLIFLVILIATFVFSWWLVDCQRNYYNSFIEKERDLWQE